MQAGLTQITHKKENVLARIGTLLVAAYLIACILAYIAVPILALSWIQYPFIGLLIGNDLQINQSMPPLSRELAGLDILKESESKIIRIDGQDILNVHQLYDRLSLNKPGDEIVLDFRTNRGQLQQFTLVLTTFSTTDFLRFLILPYFVGISCLVVGIWIFFFRNRQKSVKVFTIFAVSVSLSVGLLFNANTSYELDSLWILGICLAGASFFSIALYFPESDLYVLKYPALSWVVYIPGILLFLLFLFPQFTDLVLVSPPDSLVIFIKLYMAVGFIFYISWMGYRWLRARSPKIRIQYGLILLGIFISFAPVIGWIIFSLINSSLTYSPYLLAFIPFYTITTATSLSKNSSLKTDYITRQTLVYTTLAFLTVAAYSFLITGFTIISGSVIGFSNPVLIGITIFILIIIFLPLREGFQKYIDKILNRSQELYRQQIQSFSHELTQSLDANAINKLLRKSLQKNFSIEQIHIYTLSPESDLYTALPAEGGYPTSELIFPVDSGLVKILSTHRTSLFIGDSQSIPVALISELPRLSLLGSILFIPLPGRKSLVGWIALGPKKSNRPFSQQDVSFLETLCDQTALALERAQAVADLERRIHQMTVLNRITQGINLTNNYDDILELIYAQTTQIFSIHDFHISLIDDRTGHLTSIFYLEDGERNTDMENQPVPHTVGLESEVIKISRALITQDFDRECRSRGVSSGSRKIHAWIGVPLNTGEKTIGVLSLGSLDPEITFTIEQANLLQAIADQAAGAIVRTGLLDEAERRALQLTTLNEAARSMSLTLELVPLLNQILRSAVDILNSEAGNLLLVDNESGEYTVQAVLGPVGALLGMRLPPATGIVGKVVTTRQAIIVQKMDPSVVGSEDDPPEKNASFRDMVIAPMLYRDEVSGVIEVTNRKDSLSFTKDDLDLLAAFASQAAIALENARLFTLTDQRLAERVEELSVLQRIDRELNTSLDIGKALRVTLDWALNKTQAEAGLVSMIEGNMARIMAAEGYGSEELDQYQQNGLPLDFSPIQDAIHTGFPQIVPVTAAGSFILNGALQQIVIPLRRESQTIGLVFLESRVPNPKAEETIGFLDRLGDHASIAIENARLYAAVQDANQAKSDFVSFVSHELKTPMTSIRGFSDLIASGVVGQINENQANFLNIIRSNIDRMATLVSDLTDISRIEAGRLYLEFSAVPVLEIVDEVVKSTKNQIQAKKQTLTLNIAQDIPQVWGDRNRLIQVLTNLVSNANKYTHPEGLIQIFAESSKNISNGGSPQVIHFLVEDNGYGISEESQARIFQKFYRSDDQKIRDSPGTGLGLNITKQLVELQGGQIWFESKFRQGTTFHVILPIAEKG